MFDHIHPQAVHYLISPGLRAISDVPGLTLEQKNARAAEILAVMSSVNPYDAYSLMLYGQSFVLNDLCGNAARDALVESRSGMMGGTESPMKWRAMSAYASMARTLCQTANTFLKVRKEMAPPPTRSGGPGRKPRQPATEPAEHASPDAEGSGVTDRDATAASTHPAADSRVVKPGAAGGKRSDIGMETRNEQNAAPAPNVALHAPEAPREARAGAGMPAAPAPDVARPEPVDARSASDVIARSGATKQPPRSWRPLPYAPDDMETGRLNQNLSFSTNAGSDPLVSRTAVIASAAGTASAANLLHLVRIDAGLNEPRPISALATPPPLGVARSYEATATPRRIRDGPGTNFSRRRSS